jgi:hypothetical protein
MIIVEGPDGAGKTNLIARMTNELGIPVHERHAGSRDGPIENLWDWTSRDLASWEGSDVMIYDRHPLISEYIYGPAIRGRLAWGFTHPSAHGMRRRMEQQCLLILALPDFHTVERNVQATEEDQLEGVSTKIEFIYWSYAALRSSWNGWMVDYDYPRSFDPAGNDLETEGKGSYRSVLRAAKLHVATWEKIRHVR